MSEQTPLEPTPDVRNRALLSTMGRTAWVAVLVMTAWWWLFWRVHVEPGETLRVTRSFGEVNPDSNTYRVVPQTEEMSKVKGMLEQAYGEGNWFFNPILYKTTVDKPARQRRRRGRQPQLKSESLMTIEAGQIGVVTSLSGKEVESGFLVKQPGYKGPMEDVLAPGRYRINPRAFQVDVVKATVIEPGYVGVVTSQTGKKRTTDRLAEPGEIGVMRRVLQPGLYHLNPKAFKVDVIEIGYREHSIVGIRFPSRDGYQIECDITVIWGIHPDHAPHIVKEIGKTDEEIKVKVIDQVVQSASRIKGGEYSAAQLVSGADRTRFVEEFTKKLREECEGNRIEILSGLIRRINIPQDIRKPIQEVKIQNERQTTLKDEQRTQEKRNELETVKGDVAKMVKVTEAETRKMVAEARQEGEKKAAEIDASAEAEIAEIMAEVAKTEAAIERMQGEGKAIETQLIEEAKADRFTQIVKAFGSPEAYTRYTFATTLPEDFRVVLRYAGEGTFWTDLPKELKSLQTASSLKILKGQKK